MTDRTPEDGEPIPYRTDNDAGRVEVLFETETFWLEQQGIAVLAGVQSPTISYNLKEIYAPGEQAHEGTLRRILKVRRERSPEVRREVEFYSRGAIISERCRVNSAHAAQFPIEATKTLRGEVAKRLAEEQHEQFRVRQNREFESDLEAEVKRIASKRPLASKEES